MAWVTEDTLEYGLPFVKGGTIEQCVAIIGQHDARLWVALLFTITSELIRDTTMDTPAFVNALVGALTDDDAFDDAPPRDGEPSSDD